MGAGSGMGDGRGGRGYWKRGGGGGGIWDPKVCIPKMARQDFPECKSRCLARWSLWSGGGGGWHRPSVSDCVPLAAPIGLSPLLILTLCGPELGGGGGPGINSEAAVSPFGSGRACPRRRPTPTVHFDRLRCSQVHQRVLACPLPRWSGVPSAGLHRVSGVHPGHGSLLLWGGLPPPSSCGVRPFYSFPFGEGGGLPGTAGRAGGGDRPLGPRPRTGLNRDTWATRTRTALRLDGPHHTWTGIEGKGMGGQGCP